MSCLHASTLPVVSRCTCPVVSRGTCPVVSCGTIHSSAALHIFTQFRLNFASIFCMSKNYFRHFSQCLQWFREVSEFFCCFFFGVCNLSTRSRGTGQPIRRTARQQAVMMRDRHEIKKSLAVLAHQRQDRRNQSSRFPTDNHGTMHARPSTRSNSVHRESANR